VTLIVSICSAQYLNFFVVTDIHYDIAYQQNYSYPYLCHSVGIDGEKFNPVPTNDTAPLGRYYCDSPLTLAALTFQQMKAVNPNPDFILLLGDSVAHFTSTLLNQQGVYDKQADENLVLSTFTKVTQLFTQYFPNTQLLPVIGNNDGFQDYQIPEGVEGTDYLKFLYKLWSPLIGFMTDTFMKGGYYASITKGGLNFICLNTNYFSTHIKLPLVEADEQLEWLRSQLQANRAKSIIIMHISPGVSIYGKGDPDWDNDYVTKFLSIVTAFQSKISYIFAGHYHFGFFQIVQGTQLSIIIHPSVSPFFGNNPGFRYYTLNGGTQDYVDYTYDLNQTGWYTHRFSQMYNLDTFNFTSVYSMLSKNFTMLNQFLARSYGLDVEPGITNEYVWNLSLGLDYNTQQSLGRSVTLCSMQNLVFNDFKKCIGNVRGLLRGRNH